MCALVWNVGWIAGSLDRWLFAVTGRLDDIRQRPGIGFWDRLDERCSYLRCAVYQREVLS